MPILSDKRKDEIRAKAREYVRAESRKATNPFGEGIFSDHIEPVVRHAVELAKRTGADEEVVELAAWLHDIGSILGDNKNHHITGARVAEALLKSLDCGDETIAKVKHCIEAHRSSSDNPRETLEAECVACADAMSHFDSFVYLVMLRIVVLGRDVPQAKRELKRKLQRSWEKLMPSVRDRYREKYEAALLLLE